MRFQLMILILASAFSAGWHAPAESLRTVGSAVTSFFEWFGELGQFCGRLIRAIFSRPFEGRELLRQMDVIGAQSLILAMLAGAATGVVMSLQTRDSLTRFGAKAMLPTVIVFALLKETGPIITGLVVSGRVAAGIGSELGSMKVTEQIDAMEASAVNPYSYLAATRVLACIMVLPLLTLAADFGGIVMGWVATTLAESTSLVHFMNSGFKNVTFRDFLPPTLKTCFYGWIIGVVACFQGMRAHGGTEGVGRAATSSVVLSSLFIILGDVLLVRLILVFFP